MKNKSVILNEVKNPAVNYAELITRSFGKNRLRRLEPQAPANVQKPKSFCLRMTLVGFLLFAFIFSGCIRLTGNAGYWKKDAETGEYQGKSVNLDSDDLIYPDRAKGSITI